MVIGVIRDRYGWMVFVGEGTREDVCMEGASPGPPPLTSPRQNALMAKTSSSRRKMQSRDVVLLTREEENERKAKLRRARNEHKQTFRKMQAAKAKRKSQIAEDIKAGVVKKKEGKNSQIELSSLVPTGEGNTLKSGTRDKKVRGVPAIRPGETFPEYNERVKDKMSELIHNTNIRETSARKKAYRAKKEAKKKEKKSKIREERDSRLNEVEHLRKRSDGSNPSPVVHAVDKNGKLMWLDKVPFGEQALRPPEWDDSASKMIQRQQAKQLAARKELSSSDLFALRVQEVQKAKAMLAWQKLKRA
jgi:hypothetical protein